MGLFIRKTAKVKIKNDIIALSYILILYILNTFKSIKNQD